MVTVGEEKLEVEVSNDPFSMGDMVGGCGLYKIADSWHSFWPPKWLNKFLRIHRCPMQMVSSNYL